MSLSCRSSALLALVVAAFIASGCGETVIDQTKVQEQIKASAEKSGRTDDVSSVDCPSGIEVDPGAKFSCTVHLAGGQTETATLKIRNKDADLDFLYLGPRK
jgi:NAD(P)H-hydrate repair Nnr-like enzyme with NAD(P)H-hydrate epimerase domain